MPTLFEVACNASIFGHKRRAKHRDDFGDEQTIGLHLRKRDYENFAEDYKRHSFGTYLGEYKEKWYVSTMSAEDSAPTALEKFDTLKHLKNKWELD